MGKRFMALILGCALAASLAPPAHAGIVVYDKDGKKLEIGGRLQLQYLRVDPDGGEAEDDLFFRRLRPYVAGSVTESWWGKIQFDFGKSLDGNEVAVKDAYMQYRGWKNVRLSIGNTKTPFSREYLTSSKRQQTVERGFVGDHNFGSPDRLLGLKLAGQNESKKVTYEVAVGAEHVDPDVRRIDFDTPVNNAGDWNEGLIVAGRVDFHPRGYMKFDQGDFHSTDTSVPPKGGKRNKFNFSLAAFSWTNDDDNNTYTDPVTGLSTSSSKVDLDSAEGFEISAGLRGKGVSIDVEYDLISGDTVDPTFTGGIWRGGSTDLDKFQIEGGYMFPGNRWELAGRWQFLDADNYQDAWEATEVALNYFLNKHKVKVQLTYRMGENVFGVKGDDIDTQFLQFQYVF
ncbi:MAG: hypothetical protein GY719_40610 [bacterium]|nr:hypothetical protein [bacterium]